jgi:hypothetical protein
LATSQYEYSHGTGADPGRDGIGTHIDVDIDAYTYTEPTAKGKEEEGFASRDQKVERWIEE